MRYSIHKMINLWKENSFNDNYVHSQQGRVKWLEASDAVVNESVAHEHLHANQLHTLLSCLFFCIARRQWLTWFFTAASFATFMCLLIKRDEVHTSPWDKSRYSVYKRNAFPNRSLLPILCRYHFHLSQHLQGFRGQEGLKWFLGYLLATLRILTSLLSVSGISHLLTASWNQEPGAGLP